MSCIEVDSRRGHGGFTLRLIDLRQFMAVGVMFGIATRNRSAKTSLNINQERYKKAFARTATSALGVKQNEQLQNGINDESSTFILGNFNSTCHPKHLTKPLVICDDLGLGQDHAGVQVVVY